MNHVAEETSQPKSARGRRLPEQPVILVPGCHFFTTTAALPAGTAARELAGLADLALEADSPFDNEQLARGYFAQPAAGGLVVFAALRRKFAAQQEAWTKASFVVPDFATWLPGATATTGIVVLETAEAVSALEFAAGSAVPRRIVSRPVPAEPGGEESIAAAREAVLARLVPGGRRVSRYRLASVPCTVKGGRYLFHWEAQGSAVETKAEAGALTAAQLWAMDLREPAFLRVKRRDFQWNRYAWGALVGLGMAAVALVVAEFGLVGLHLLNARRQDRIEAQRAAARQSEIDTDIANRLAGYIDRKPQPLELLAYVNDLRPRSIYFTRVSMEGGLQMLVDGSTSSLAEVNEFESALRRAPALASAEVKEARGREGGGTFKLSLVFKPGFTPGATPPRGADNSGPGRPPEAGPVVAVPKSGAPGDPRFLRRAGGPSSDTMPPVGPQLGPRPERLPPPAVPPPAPPPESSATPVAQP